MLAPQGVPYCHFQLLCLSLSTGGIGSTEANQLEHIIITCIMYKYSLHDDSRFPMSALPDAKAYTWSLQIHRKFLGQIMVISSLHLLAFAVCGTQWMLFVDKTKSPIMSLQEKTCIASAVGEPLGHMTEMFSICLSIARPGDPSNPIPVAVSFNSAYTIWTLDEYDTYCSHGLHNSIF